MNWNLKYIRFVRNPNVPDEFVVCNSYMYPIEWRKVIKNIIQIILNMKNDFESCGEHLRNLITPYCTLLEFFKSLKRQKEEGNEDKFNEVLDFLMNHNFDNINDIIAFSKIDQMEKANWRDSDLFKSKEQKR